MDICLFVKIVYWPNADWLTCRFLIFSNLYKKRKNICNKKQNLHEESPKKLACLVLVGLSVS
jgi:hypothetical protein